MEENCSFICRERECLMRADQGMYKGNGTVTCISVLVYTVHVQCIHVHVL